MRPVLGVPVAHYWAPLFTPSVSHYGLGLWRECLTVLADYCEDAQVIGSVGVADVKVESAQFTVNQYPIDSHPRMLVGKGIAKAASDSVEYVLKSIKLLARDTTQAWQIRVARDDNRIRTRACRARRRLDLSLSTICIEFD